MTDSAELQSPDPDVVVCGNGWYCREPIHNFRSWGEPPDTFEYLGIRASRSCKRTRA
jgi:hypothetical protein